MRTVHRDQLATLMVALLLLLYSVYIALQGFPLLWGVPEMAGTGLAVFLVSQQVVGRGRFQHGRFIAVAGLAAMMVGVVAMITKSDDALTVFMAAIGALWLIERYEATQPRRHALHARTSR